MTDITATFPPASSAPSKADEHRAVRFWLYAIAGIVALMVMVGGATRLTDSGLSITEWKPVTGIIPPLSESDWLAEKEKYRTTTEYQTQNKGMSMAEFKVIYWWEWGHRFLGRMIGFAVIIPMIFFWARGALPGWLKPRLLFLVALGGLQGFIGWWMVKSGLVDRVDVSQVRLAVHLTLACIIFAYTIWLARSLALHDGAAAPEMGWQAGAVSVLVLVQIFAGGLVAGLDAGMAYNTWPLMNGALIPEGMAAIDPLWKNLTDNAMTVQFVHRITAYVLLTAVVLHALSISRALPGTSHARRAALLLALVCAQAAMGIVTLVLQVPMSWALAHQLGAVIVLGFAIAHWHAFAPRQHAQA